MAQKIFGVIKEERCFETKSFLSDAIMAFREELEQRIKMAKEMKASVSSVVEFQRWWVLKSKIFVAQKSTCSKEILIPTTLNHL